MTDAQLVEFATEFRRGMIGRKSSRYACFMICAPLASLLGMHGASMSLSKGWIKYGPDGIEHFWLSLSDGRVLDPTADQFNKDFPASPMPPVYLGAPTHLHPAGEPA